MIPDKELELYLAIRHPKLVDGKETLPEELDYLN